jgi:hypothetical protein
VRKATKRCTHALPWEVTLLRHAYLIPRASSYDDLSRRFPCADARVQLVAGRAIRSAPGSFRPVSSCGCTARTQTADRRICSGPCVRTKHWGHGRCVRWLFQLVLGALGAARHTFGLLSRRERRLSWSRFDGDLSLTVQCALERKLKRRTAVWQFCDCVRMRQIVFLDCHGRVLVIACHCYTVRVACIGNNQKLLKRCVFGPWI